MANLSRSQHTPPLRHAPHRHVKRLLFGALSLSLPPLAGRYHGRYTKRSWQLIADSLLALIMFALLGSVLFFLTRSFPFGNPVVVMLQVPTQAKSGDRIRAQARVINFGTENVSHVTLEFTAPQGTRILSSTQKLTDEKKLRWVIPEIKRQQTITLTTELQIAARPETAQTLTANLQYTKDGRREQDRAQATWLVKGSVVTATIEAPKTMHIGESGSLLLTIKNTGEIDIPSVTVLINPPIEVVLTRPDAHATATEWPLGSLSAGETRVLKATIDPRSASNKPVQITLDVKMTTNGVWATQDSLLLPITIYEAASIRDIANQNAQTSTLEFAAEAHYYSEAGVQFGFGPLPPRVGEMTGYRIFWVIHAGSVTTDGITVHAQLPKNAHWNGHATITHGDSLGYDERTRTIRWYVGSLSPLDGSVSGSFEITITPERPDIGKTLRLLDPSTVVVPILGAQTRPAITTAITDALAAGKGTVLKP